MDVPFGLIMLVGKYLFLALVYGFLYWAFRGLFAQSALEAKSQPFAASQPVAVPAPLTVSVPMTVAAPAAIPAPVAAPVMAPAAYDPTPLPAPARAALIVEDAGQSGLTSGQVIDLTAAVTIGRAEDNGIVIADKFCSTHHALLFLQGGQRILRDRNSTNGTLHNGQRVEQDVVLADGDTVTIGTVVLRYRAGNE
ncbi:MAG: FHA domain-containing protein [Armatimonadota bacterium]